MENQSKVETGSKKLKLNLNKLMKRISKQESFRFYNRFSLQRRNGRLKKITPNNT